MKIKPKIIYLYLFFATFFLIKKFFFDFEFFLFKKQNVTPGADFTKFLETRDFYRYKCKNVKRIGGLPGIVKNMPDDLKR